MYDAYSLYLGVTCMYRLPEVYEVTDPCRMKSDRHFPESPTAPLAL